MALAGGAPGLTALFIKFIDVGYTFIVLLNYDPEDVEPLMEQIRDLEVPESNQGKIMKMRCDE